MVIQRVVVIPRGKSGAFGKMKMPDGSDVLVIDRKVHEEALRAANEKLGKIVPTIKGAPRRASKGRAA